MRQSRPAQAAGAMTRQQRLAWLRLIRSENVGPVTFRELINHFGSAEAALDALPELAKRGGRRIRIAGSDEAERELAAVETRGARHGRPRRAGIPPRLCATSTAPRR